MRVVIGKKKKISQPVLPWPRPDVTRGFVQRTLLPRKVRIFSTRSGDV